MFNLNLEFIRFSDEAVDVAGKVPGRLCPYYDIMKSTMPIYFGKKSAEELEFDGTEIQEY